MRVTEPRDMDARFAEAFNVGDIEDIMSLYEQNARFMRQDGSIVVGLEAIRVEVLNLLAFEGQMSAENLYTVEMDNLALLRTQFKLVKLTPGDEAFGIAIYATEVIRRQFDGSWLYIIDHPSEVKEIIRS